MNDEATRRTAVVVPVPEASEFTEHWRRLYTDGGRRGMPPHVTLVSPWVPLSAIDDDVLARLAACVRAVGPFAFELTEVDSFPQGVLFLRVSPLEGFRALIEAVCAEFPDHPPYGGQYAPQDVLPHLTVAVAESFPNGAGNGDRAIFADATQAVSPSLPIAATVREVQLLHDDGVSWRLSHRLRLAERR